MKITIVGRQMTVPEDLKPIIEAKLQKFDKYFRDDASASVKLSTLRGRERVEITITSAGTIYRGEVTDSTFRNALDSASESIERQIRKNKTRLAKRLREHPIEDLYKEPELLDEDEEVIIRQKSFPLTEMSAEEAILQMNLLGHDFYVFADENTKEVNIVYRRRDGDYGLIIPQL